MSMPEPKAIIRDGDALVEFHLGGSVVGEFNFSKVLRTWWKAVIGPVEKGLEVVK